MFAAVDVFYDESRNFARAACVLFADPHRDAVAEEAVATISPIVAYEPGKFYRRELPCIEAVLAPRLVGLRAVIIDGYVYLSKDKRPGLGWYVHQRFRVPVIGIAKNALHRRRDIRRPRVPRRKPATAICYTRRLSIRRRRPRAENARSESHSDAVEARGSNCASR